MCRDTLNICKHVCVARCPVCVCVCVSTHSLCLQVVPHLLVFVLSQLLVPTVVIFGKDGLNLLICVALSKYTNNNTFSCTITCDVCLDVFLRMYV